MNLIAIPSNIAEASAVKFGIALSALSGDEPITIDVSKVKWAFPFGSLVIASQIRRLRNNGRETKVVGYNPSEKAHTYLAHIGFFQTIGCNIGNSPGTADGSDRYLPITILSHSDLMFDEFFDDNPVQVAIQKKAEHLAQVLSGSNQLKVTRPIAYCFRELIRNVFEHSESDECMIAAQAYRDGRVLVGVVDYGRGLQQSLSQAYSPATHLAAIKLALKPGVSRNVGITSDSVWANSGFGLYVLSELGRMNGYFSIMSGDALFSLGERSASFTKSSHNETAINIIFRKMPGTNLEQQIESIIEKGESLASSEGRSAKASKSSHITG